MYAAYESLSPTMKQMLDEMTAVHDFRQVNNFFATSGPSQAQTAQTPPVEHPVVRTHSESGRKALFVNPGFTTHIVDLARSESDAILEFLFAHATKPEFIYRHRWQVNDLLLWDNRCTVHHAIHDFLRHRAPASASDNRSWRLGRELRRLRIAPGYLDDSTCDASVNYG